MSFKHTKFDDSETMRSFAKVGVEKGLVTPETSSVVKTASSKISATGDLVQDVMILCASLRKAGMEKHAEDLENNFLLYKKSESLYETFKETGEDLVDMAHPEGSHKLQDLEHTVLTITDRHQKIKDIVNKKPTGKLDGSLKRLAAKNNSNKNKLNIIKSSFKVSLAQITEATARQQVAQDFINSAIRAAESASSLGTKNFKVSFLLGNPLNNVNESIAAMKRINIDTFGTAEARSIEGMLWTAVTKSGSVDAEASTIDKFIKLVTDAKNNIFHAGRVAGEIESEWYTRLIQNKIDAQDPAKQLKASFERQKSELNGLLQQAKQLQVKSKPQSKKYIDEEVSTLTYVISTINIDGTQEELNSLKDEVNEHKSFLKNFKQSHTI